MGSDMARDKYTLVVVDVQPTFDGHDRILKPVAALVRKAKKDNAPIIFLEFCGRGKTCRGVKRYAGAKKYTVIKSTQDGSKEVANICKHYKLPTNIVACGLYISACVRDTVVGLNRQGFRVQLHKDACTDFESANYTKDHLEYMSGRKNVTLV
jgi:nicotinamidase-related amidase